MNSVKWLPICLLLLGSLAFGQAPVTPTNLGPIRTTTQDDIGFSTAPANPPPNTCRRYYNNATGQETWINSTGGNCGGGGSSGGGSIPATGTVGALCYFSSPNSVFCDPNALTDGSGHLSALTINVNSFTISGTGAGTIDMLCGTSVGNPSTGNARIYCDSGTNLLTCLLSTGSSCSGSGGSTPGGSNQQVQFNDSNSFAGAAGILWDKNTPQLFVQASTAATSGGNVNSPPLNLCSNWFNGSVSGQDCWTLQDIVLPANNANARSILKFAHTGTTGNSNGSNFTFAFNPDGTFGTCAHDDASGFTTNTVGCWLLAVANTGGAGPDFNLVNTATSGSGRTRFWQGSLSTLGSVAHGWMTDPNNNNSQQFGGVYCLWNSGCHGWLLLDGVGSNLPEIYLGGTAWSGGGSAALRIDVSNGGSRTGMKWYGIFTADAGATFDASVMTASNAFKIPVGASCVASASGSMCYDSSTNLGVIGENGTAHNVATRSGSLTNGNYASQNSSGDFVDSGVPVVAAWYAMPWGGNGGLNFPTANTTKLWAFVPLVSVTNSGHMYYHVNTADNTANLYNFGVYNSTPSLVCQIGATAGSTFAPSTGDKSIAWSSPCSLTAGKKYYLAMTAQATTVAITSGTSVISTQCNVAPSSGSATTNAVFNTITTPADATGSCSTPNIGFMP